MKFSAISVVAGTFCLAVTAMAADVYNTVPAGDAQYRQCITRSNNTYEDGNARSPIAGQSKVQAFCTCVWNETPDNFRGDLAAFADSPKGAAINKICEKYADWGT